MAQTYPSRVGIRDDDGLVVAQQLVLTHEQLDTVVDALNARALDRQADEYGDGPADAAADLYRALTGEDPDEAHSLEAALGRSDGATTTGRGHGDGVD